MLRAIFLLLQSQNLGDSMLRLQAGLGLNPAVSSWLHPLSLFPHPPKEQQKLTGPLQRLSQAPGGCLPELLWPPPHQPGLSLVSHPLPAQESGGYQVYRAELPPLCSGSQRARTPKHRLTGLHGIVRASSARIQSPLMLEVPNSQRAAHKPGGRRVRHHGAQR